MSRPDTGPWWAKVNHDGPSHAWPEVRPDQPTADDVAAVCGLLAEPADLMPTDDDRCWWCLFSLAQPTSRAARVARLDHSQWLWFDSAASTAHALG